MVVWQSFCGVNGETHSREPDLSTVLKNCQRKFEALKFMIPVFRPIFSFGGLARLLRHERGNTCMGTRLICGLGKRPHRKDRRVEAYDTSLPSLLFPSSSLSFRSRVPSCHKRVINQLSPPVSLPRELSQTSDTPPLLKVPHPTLSITSPRASIRPVM